MIEKRQKAYVCAIDGSVISRVQKDEKFRDIVNGATINLCDGSSIVTMVNYIYGTRYRVFNGPELFESYIEKPYKHIIIGNRKNKVDDVRNILVQKGVDNELIHIDVPFVRIEEFDYVGIAEAINRTNPDFIWVSLGNPKQEQFMARILPYIECGVMVGIGAAVDFYLGYLHNRKKDFAGIRFIWLERIVKDPKKQWNRVKEALSVFPKMFIKEKRKRQR